MRGSKNSKLAKLAKLAKGVKEAGAKMKLRIKKFGPEKKKPSSAIQLSYPIERCEITSGSPGFKIYEDWEPFQLNIGRPSNLNPIISPRLPSFREDSVVNMALDKTNVFIWRVSRRNNTVEKLFVKNRDATRVYQHSRAIDV